jgi:hypothetical protein
MAISSNMVSALLRNSSSDIETMGCGTTEYGRSGCLSRRRCVCVAVAKPEVTMVAVAMPRFSSSTLSWTLHDVQEPQSAMPVTTA